MRDLAIEIKNLSFSYLPLAKNFESFDIVKKSITKHQEHPECPEHQDYIDSSDYSKNLRYSNYSGYSKVRLKNTLKIKNNVLNNINLEVEQGSFVSILGPNGSGKSTLINLISKVLKDYSGTIKIFGRDIKALSSKEIAKFVSVVPQYSDVQFNFSVEEMVLMGRYPYIPRFGSEKLKDFEIAERAMYLTKTFELRDKKVGELSGGEKQRVIIAQALAQDSPIILLDEPTSHLDINFQIEIMELFSNINKNEHKTVVGIFHDINLAANYSEYIVFLKHGQVFASGSIENTITRENIKNVFNSDVYIGRNPFTGKIYISPTFLKTHIKKEERHDYKESEKYKRYEKLKIHVIGGGGAASPILNFLDSLGFIVTCGVVNYLDSDLNTAQALGINYVSEAPFSPISTATQNQNLDFIKQSDIVILPPVVFGHGNFSNLLSVKQAIKMGKKVIVIDKGDIEKRDFTGGKAAKIYNKILQNSKPQKDIIIIDDINKLEQILESVSI